MRKTAAGSELLFAYGTLQDAELQRIPTLYQREKVAVRLEDGGAAEAWATRRTAEGAPYSGGALSLLQREEVLAALRRSILY